MKNKSLKLIFAASLVVAFATSCTTSSADSEVDPAILTYIVTQSINNNSTNTDPVTGLCLSNVAAMNTCVGGTGVGQGFSGNLCATPASREKLGTSTATACIGKAINDTKCNFSENKYVDAVAADATFKDCK